MSSFLIKTDIKRQKLFPSLETVEIGGIRYIIQQDSKTKEYYIYPWGSDKSNSFKSIQEVDSFLKDKLVASLSHLVEAGDNGYYNAKELTWTSPNNSGLMFCEQDFTCVINQADDKYLVWGKFSYNDPDFTQSSDNLQDAKDFAQHQLELFLDQFKER